MVRKNELERLRRQFPVGTRVELIEMDDQQAPPRGRGASLRGSTEPATCRSMGYGIVAELIPGVDEFRKPCPKCGKGHDGYPAMSRIDGSDTCPECGVREANEAFSSRGSHDPFLIADHVGKIYHSVPDRPKERRH